MLVELITRDGKPPKYKGYNAIEVQDGCKKVEFAEVPPAEHLGGNCFLLTHARINGAIVTLYRPLYISPGITPTLHIEANDTN